MHISSQTDNTTIWCTVWQVHKQYKIFIVYVQTEIHHYILNILLDKLLVLFAVGAERCVENVDKLRFGINQQNMLFSGDFHGTI